MKRSFYSEGVLSLIKKSRKLITLLFVVIGFQVTALAQFVHPGLTNKRSDLDRVKYMVEAQIDPWYSSYQEMASDSRASFNYSVRGRSTFTELGRDNGVNYNACLLYTSPSPRDQRGSRMPSSA